MNGYKYLAGTVVCMIAVLIGFIVVLVQFNLMVYPASITAFSLNTGERGVCQIEFLGEKAQLTIPDLELLINQGAIGRQMLTENTYQALESGGKLASQVWKARLNDFTLEDEFEQLLNTFKTSELLPLKE